jgi:hypothetical protein
MGGHYGSIHVRTNERDEVRVAVENLNHGETGKFYIAPSIDGWVTVFPENHGQDSSVAEALASKLADKAIIYCTVYDDDIFSYFLFENGEIADRYNSCPEYFDDNNTEPRGGNASAFAKLITPDRVAELQALLDRERFTFELERLEKFAEIVGLPNIAAAYEYLIDNDVGEIRQRNKFIHVPDLSIEKKGRRAAETKIRNELKDLQKKRVLIVDHPSEKAPLGNFFKANIWADNPGRAEVLAVWYDVISRDPAHTTWKRFVGAEWREAALDITLNVAPVAMAFSRSGSLLAILAAQRVEVWDLGVKKIIAEKDFVGRPNEMAFAVDDKWLFVVVSHNSAIELHRIALNPGLTDESITDAIGHIQRIVPHPEAQLLVGIDNTGFLIVVEIESMKIVTQRWIPDKSSLLQFGHFRNAALDSVRQLAPLLGAQAENYLKSAERSSIPSDRIRVACFDENGSHLFCAGAGVYGVDWKDVMEGADMSSIEPKFSVEPELAQNETRYGTVDRRLVYSVLYDTARKRILYAGLEGKISFYDLDDGKSGTLLASPGGAAMIKLSLANDRTVLIATAHRFDFEDRTQRPQRFQIWNYRTLCERAGVAY